MRRLVCAVRHRPSGVAATLSGTPDLPAVAAILAAVGDVEGARASDVRDVDGRWSAVVRPWVAGAPVPLGDAFGSKAAAVAAEVEYLSAVLDLPVPR